MAQRIDVAYDDPFALRLDPTQLAERLKRLGDTRVRRAGPGTEVLLSE
jgi:hypothetical protein